MIRSILQAFEDRERFARDNPEGGWAEWAQKNPDAARLLNQAMKAVNDGR